MLLLSGFTGLLDFYHIQYSES